MAAIVDPDVELARDALGRVLIAVSTATFDELGVTLAGVRGLRADLDRVSVAITRRANELVPSGGPLGGGEQLWGRAGRDTPDDDDPAGDGGTGGEGPDNGPDDGPGDDPPPPPPPPPPDPEEARREARRARVCVAFPQVAVAFDNGLITGAHLDVLARVTVRLDSARHSLFRALDGDIAAAATARTSHAFSLWCHDTLTRLAQQLGRDLADRQRRDTRLSFTTDPYTGMMRLFGQFHPELGQHLKNAIETEVSRAASDPARLNVPGVGGPHPHMTGRRDHLAAHALTKLVLAPSARGGVGVELAIVINQDGVARYPTGDRADPTTVARLLCNSTLRRILLDDHGIPLDVGRGSRLATPEQRLALAALYDSCAIAGCDVPFDHCEIHHVHWWEHHGLTDLDNLLPACSRHHHLIHNGTLHITLHPDRTLTTTWNNTHPPGWPATGPPPAA